MTATKPIPRSVSIMRDGQKMKLYRWERKDVASKDTSSIAFGHAQGMVDAIWQDMNLLFPPKVQAMSKKATRTLARANRLTVFLPLHTPSWVLLHELAHSMTCHHDRLGDRHGPDFAGIYALLLERYMRMPRESTAASMQAAGVRCNLQAKPIFLD